MKKLSIVIAALLAVGGAAWVGSSWFIGKETESLLKAQLEQSNQQMMASGFKQELVSYERSLFGAKAVTRMSVNEPLIGEWLNNMQFVHEIKNGPVLFSNGVKLGVSHWESHIDTGSLPAKTKAFVDQAFAGKEPLVAYTDIGFDKNISSTLTINPMDGKLDETGTTLKLAGATATGTMSATDKTGPFSLKAEAFELRNADMTFSVPSIEMEGKTAQIAGLENFTAKMPNISILAAGETEPVKMDMNIQSSGSEQNGAIQGNGVVQVANIQGKDIDLKQVDLKLDYAGLKLEGLQEIQALQAKLQDIQARMLVDETATELPEGQKQQQQLAQEAQQVSEQLLDVILNKVLQAGQSKLRYDLGLTLAKGKSSSVVDLTYAGSDKPIQLNDLMLYGPQDWGKLVRGSIDINADKAIIPEDLGMMLAQPLEQKSIIDENGQYKLQLKLLGDKAELNGTPVEFAELIGKFMPQMPSMGDTANLGIPPDLMKQIEEQGVTPEIMQQLEESDDVPKETLEMLRQLQQMSTQTQ